jgi:tetratricopeptide (TPR) repeat protein
MSDHLDRLTIIEFLENDDSIEREAIASHLATCAACRAEHDAVQGLFALFADPSTFNFAMDDSVEGDRGPMFFDVLAKLREEEAASTAADEFFSRLSLVPIASWDAIIEEHPERCTPALAGRVLQEVDAQLQRSPEEVMSLLRIVELIAVDLPEDEYRRTIGHVWRRKSNAFRHLGRYIEAVNAAALAESCYEAVRGCEFESGQAQYVLAAALFKMTRYAAAREAVARSRAILQEFGITPPLAKAMMLEAAIRTEQGDIAAALQTLTELVGIEEKLEQPLEAARVRANLAECHLRLGSFTEAMTEALAARHAYEALGNTVEQVRIAWTIGMILLGQGDRNGIDRLHEASAAFEEIKMLGDAGFVQLDIAEELLAREEWREAETAARRAASLLMGTGISVASVRALDYLRQAVANGEATAEVLRYVRAYVTADNQSAPFDPPGTPFVN